MRVVIVEDNLDISDLEELNLEGHEITVLATGEAALAYDWRAVDVAVVDLLLPGVDGIEVLRLLQRDHPQVRRVVATAAIPVEPEVYQLAHAVVEKPWEHGELRRIVEGGDPR